MYKIIYENYISEGCNNKKSLCYFLKHVKKIYFISYTNKFTAKNILVTNIHGKKIK